MRIGIDGRPATHSQSGGFKTYTKNLITHLSRVDSRNQYVIYVDRPFDFTPADNLRIEYVPTRMRLLGPPAREQFDLPRHMQRDQIRLSHFPANTAPVQQQGPFVVTIHDTLMWDEKPSLKDIPASEAFKRTSMYLYNRVSTTRAVKNARLIITVSRYARDELLRVSGINPDRVKVVYEAPSDFFRRMNRQEAASIVRSKFQIKQPFILSLCSASHRKNVPGLFAAYARLDSELRSTVQLVIVWTHALWKKKLEKQLEQFGVSRQVVFLENVTDEDLLLLYNAAGVFAFPSLSEGFGLPPLEAMACGAPVVASNRSCLPEILGSGAQFVNPCDPDSFARALADVLTSSETAEDLSRRGFEWSRRYSWDQSAKETVQVYENAIS